MNKNNSKSLDRKIQPMPEFVKKALEERSLMDDYRNRPPYQQNDYLGWINSAKLKKTKRKRLNQMLDELEKGGIYMKWTTLLPGNPEAKNLDAYCRLHLIFSQPLPNYQRHTLPQPG